jgi:hypothetical protein
MLYWLIGGFPNQGPSIPTRKQASPPHIRDKNRIALISARPDLWRWGYQVTGTRPAIIEPGLSSLWIGQGPSSAFVRAAFKPASNESRGPSSKLR